MPALISLKFHCVTLCIFLVAADLAHAIVGGGPLPKGNPGHSSAVALTLQIYGRGGRPSRGICSGTLIRKDVVVTAAHCLAGGGGAELVVFGENVGSADKSQIRRVNAAAVHPSFGKNGDAVNYDIALVRFSGSLPAGYAPIGILDDRSKLTTKMPVQLVGYGDDVTDIGRSGRKLGVESFLGDFVFEGTRRMKRIGFGNSVGDAELFLRSMMLVGATPGRGACQGDSGGPAYVRVGSAWMVAGALKGSVDRMCESGRSMYTFIGDYLPYLRRVMSTWQ